MKAVSKTGRDFVEASYKAADGSRVTGQWESLDAEAVAAGLPWRTFPWYLGQKNYAGLYWCATQSAPVGYESRLELSRLMLADFDATARKIVSQPFQLRGMVAGERIRRVPDYLVCADSGPLVIDVKPVRALRELDGVHLLDVTRHLIESRGWRYEIASEPAKVEFMNVRFLAGYRRASHFNVDVLDAVRSSVPHEDEMAIGEIVQSTTYPKHLALASLMHLLWRHEFTFDISRRLSPTTRVRAAA
jgi:hypothetical protein